MSSFEAYNWEADEQWAEFLNNVTIPASGNEQENILRLKKRYFKKNIVCKT